MSIKPLDLQTLFVKMAEVSKEQSLLKDQAALQQSQAARAQVVKELEEDHRVTESPEESETQAVKEDDSETGADNSGRREGSAGEQTEDSGSKEVVTDPNVGRHVDLSG